MAKEYEYKRVTTTKIKAVGTIDTDAGTIDVEGETKKITELLSDFNGGAVTLTCQVKEEEDLD